MYDMHILSYAFIVLGVVQLVTAVNYLIRPNAFFEGWLRDVFRMRGKPMKPFLFLRHGILAFTGVVYVVVGSPLVTGSTYFKTSPLASIFGIYWPPTTPWLLLLLAAEIGAIFALNYRYTGRITLTK